jgi:hypothetical protein
MLSGALLDEGLADFPEHWRSTGSICHRGFLAYLSQGSGRERDAKLTALFRFAHYFGWRESARAEVHLLWFENWKTPGWPLGSSTMSPRARQQPAGGEVGDALE